ncbi:hypothetical protein KY290_032122 [Solanum tuberosum]|uniref:Uncharacterized protein n=1 Tax=Solanum tuberosum TaxID=4113 RepID=A0ABQ7UB79_SOLTU|nr:hypothetical protein KY290_032122 [Solanum tuberosum]
MGKKLYSVKRGEREDVKVDIETARRDFRWDFVWRLVTFFARGRRWYRGGGIVGMLLLLGIEMNGFLG